MSEQHCNQCQFRQRPCAGSTRDASWSCETSASSGQRSTAEMLCDIGADVHRSNFDLRSIDVPFSVATASSVLWTTFFRAVLNFRIWHKWRFDTINMWAKISFRGHSSIFSWIRHTSSRSDISRHASIGWKEKCWKVAEDTSVNIRISNLRLIHLTDRLLEYWKMMAFVLLGYRPVFGIFSNCLNCSRVFDTNLVYSFRVNSWALILLQAF
jgi:hypothetical protein